MPNLLELLLSRLVAPTNPTLPASPLTMPRPARPISPYSPRYDGGPEYISAEDLMNDTHGPLVNDVKTGHRMSDDFHRRLLETLKGQQ